MEDDRRYAEMAHEITMTKTLVRGVAIAGILVVSILSGTCVAVNRSEDRAAVDKAQSDAIKAQSDAMKAMWDRQK